MAIILRTAYFFNPFCIKQVPINCSKVNPMEQKYFVLANNVFSDGCGGYLTIGTEITLADTIGKNSEDWGLLLHVAGGGEDYWITGTAEEFRTDCECVPECNCPVFVTEYEDLPLEGVANTMYTVMSGDFIGSYVWLGGVYVPLLGYTEYQALLTQTGAVNGPTALVNRNTMNMGAISYAQVAPGQYELTATNPIFSTKTTVGITSRVNVRFTASVISSTKIFINSINSAGAFANTLLVDTTFWIKQFN